MVLGYCGLRFGEAAALRVEHVDIAARRINLRRSVTSVRKLGLIEGTTKNQESRSVPIPASVARMLENDIAGLDKDLGHKTATLCGWSASWSLSKTQTQRAELP